MYPTRIFLTPAHYPRTMAIGAEAMLDLEIAGETRALTSADLHTAPTSRAPTIKRLRDSHHALARALAVGQTPQQASISTGYSASRISILLLDPSFCELLEHYKRTQAEAVLDMEARFVGMAADFAQSLHEDLMDREDQMSPEFKLEAVKVLADRAGYAPVTRSVNRNINMNIGDRLDAARRRKEDIS